MTATRSVHGTRLVLAAHGSPHASHAPAVEALRVAVAGGYGDVRIGWLEHAEPSLPEVPGHGPVQM